MQSRVEYVNVSGLRIDGRRPKEVRRVRCRLGLFGWADGSTLFEQGNTKVSPAPSVAWARYYLWSRRSYALLRNSQSTRTSNSALFGGSVHVFETGDTIYVRAFP